MRDAGDTMNLLYWLRRLYSLDTLDTRFTVSANTSLKAVPDTRASTGDKSTRTSSLPNGASPPKWKTPEFWVYYLFFITLVPLMFKTVIDISQGW